jgi:O-antigen/teichoic acid export membrane protein
MSAVANRVVKNTGILYARMAITVFISLYATRLILNALGTTDFGIFNVVAGAIAMLTFLNSAMAGATQRFISYAEGAGDTEKVKTIFNVSIVLHLGIALLVGLVLEVGGYFLFDGLLKIPMDRLATAQLIYQFMIVSTVLTIISVPYDAIINAHENMLIFAILGVVEALFKLSIALYITYNGSDKLVMYGLLTAFSSIVLLFVRRQYCLKKYIECTIQIKQHFNKHTFKEMINFASWSLLGSSSSILASYGQGIIINIFFGPMVNAAQGISGQVSGQLGAFAVTMLKAVNPSITRSEGGANREGMIRTTFISSKISFYLLILFYAPVLIEMPLIFKIWLKNIPEFTIVFCRLLLIRNLIEQLFLPLVTSILAVGKIRNFQIYNSVLNISPIIVSYILFANGFPPFTLYIVFILYSVTNGVMILIFSRKTFNLSITDFLNEVVLKCVVVFSALLFISTIPTFLMDDGTSRIFTVTFLNIISFITVIWFWGLSIEEKEYISSIYNSRSKILMGRINIYLFNYK